MKVVQRPRPRPQVFSGGEFRFVAPVDVRHQSSDLLGAGSATYITRFPSGETVGPISSSDTMSVDSFECVVSGQEP